MRRFRNPRYAPEGLERKLNPSGLGIPVTAEVAPAMTSPTTAEPTMAALPGPAPTTGQSSPSLALASMTTTAAAGSSFDPPPIPPTDPNPGNGDPPWGGPATPTTPRDPDMV